MFTPYGGFLNPSVLLAACEQQSGFLPDDQSTEASATLLDKSTFTGGAGTPFGRYKLLVRFGEGRFGLVWAAEQKEPVRRRVALKVIKLGMDTKHARRGHDRHGPAFLVMELVRGIRIAGWRRNNQRIDAPS